MKYLNYAIAFFVISFASIWTFNHVNAWAGIGLFCASIYFIAHKASSFIKGKLNEKN